MRTTLGYTAELAGFACLVSAALRVSITAALVVIGVGLIIGAQAARR